MVDEPRDFNKTFTGVGFDLVCLLLIGESNH